MPPGVALAPALLVAALSLAGAFWAGYAPPETGDMAVVFWPGTDEQQTYAAVLAAGGRVVGPTRLGNVVIAHAPDPAFASRIRQFGGLFTLAAHGLCGPATASY
jgi:hypothetical protein